MAVGSNEEGKKSTSSNIGIPENTIVLPDTIIRQMIIHEIHSNGLGPDWNYQDSLELLLGKYHVYVHIYILLNVIFTFNFNTL